MITETKLYADDKVIEKMKTIKLINLFNKIANGEEVPKKIKYKNKIYEWKEYDVCYGKTMTKKGWVKEHGYVAEENRTYFYLKHCYQDLNNEVEILEEEKKIEKINPEHMSIYEMVLKINEIIDYLKSKGDE